RRGHGPGRQGRFLQDRLRDLPAAHRPGLRQPDHHRAGRVRPGRRRADPHRDRRWGHRRADRGGHRRAVPGGRAPQVIPPPPAPPGLWTIPVRGRAALSALAWVLVYGAALVVVVLLGLVTAWSLGAGRPDTALLALVVLAGTA